MKKKKGPDPRTEKREEQRKRKKKKGKERKRKRGSRPKDCQGLGPVHSGFGAHPSTTPSQSAGPQCPRPQPVSAPPAAASVHAAPLSPPSRTTHIDTLVARSKSRHWQRPGRARIPRHPPPQDAGPCRLLPPARPRPDTRPGPPRSPHGCPLPFDLELAPSDPPTSSASRAAPQHFSLDAVTAPLRSSILPLYCPTRRSTLCAAAALLRVRLSGSVSPRSRLILNETTRRGNMRRYRHSWWTCSRDLQSPCVQLWEAHRAHWREAHRHCVSAALEGRVPSTDRICSADSMHRLYIYPAPALFEPATKPTAPTI